MGVFSRFESKAEDAIEGSSGKGRGGIEPVKIAKRACKEMEREKMVGVGHEYAPTLYNVLVSPKDDERMSGYYPSLAGEIETYLQSRATQTNLTFDCPPLVRFIVDDGLRRGKFDIIAESVSPAIIDELRHEEMVHYGLEREEPVQPQPMPRPQQPIYQQQQPNYPPQQNYQQQPNYYDSSYAQSYSAPQEESYVGFGAVYEEPSYAESYQDVSYGPVSSGPYEALSPYEAVSSTPSASAFRGGAVAGASSSAAARSYRPAPAPSVPEQRPTPVPGTDRTVILGAARPQKPKAELVNCATGQTYELKTDRTIIGRESDCDVTILDPSVSRHHAEILHSDTGWLVHDTGSTNGTSVNGSMTTKARIYDGDTIDVGKTKLEFREG